VSYLQNNTFFAFLLIAQSCIWSDLIDSRINRPHQTHGNTVATLYLLHVCTMIFAKKLINHKQIWAHYILI